MTGGLVRGWGKATMEESDQEPVHGRWPADSIRNVAVPVNATSHADLDR
jgi:xanthine dehydrogenase YagR molybdenum-binding subunit